MMCEKYKVKTDVCIISSSILWVSKINLVGQIQVINKKELTADIKNYDCDKIGISQQDAWVEKW